ncbi:PAS domain S-box protein [Haloarcula sp. CBA1130]|uniref:sensor histidine kinase n=1 Tax=unclassified Haloarcula TaxID=2624677 RepID=UPI0012470936|nr:MULTISPECIES: ATP-binding protein [unclassified Haloarcula]KAA9397124.1 PAS domain S-box protein [Haloarcula sp. CBA1129]KAA9402838.1 PAS domain S-box protein [Haloarcula sp. CBA1130]
MDDPLDGVEGSDSTEQDRYLAAMQDLTAAMAASGESFRERVEPVLAVGREHLGFPNGHITVVSGDEHEIVASSGLSETIAAGAKTPLSETYCRHTLDGSGIHVIADASESMVTDPAYERFELEAYIGAPLQANGAEYGTLCFVNDDEAIAELSDWQQTLFNHLMQWVEAEIERELAVDTRERSQRLLEATFNSPETFIGILDADGNLIRANERALGFIDVDDETVFGEPFWEAPWWNHDEAVARRCQDAVERAGTGEMVRFEAEHIGADGQRISTSVVARPVAVDGTVEKIIVEGTDITDLKRREEQMEFFNSILRHDILNGMNVIEARAETLADALSGTQETYAETILDWSRDIVDLTQKVRSVLSTMSDDGLTKAETIELGPVVEGATRKAASMDTECTLKTDVPDGIEVVADDLLDDVIGNILTNAVEHGGSGTTVEVTTERVGSMVHLRIADDGPGIPPGEREAIFEKGERGTESTGTGFGLYFVSVMVDSYGGDIWVENSDLGGSEFVVELPLE